MSNNFSSIDAQDDLSSLIKVASNEQLPYVQPTKHKPLFNVGKLVLWNMTQPFSKRIAYADMVQRTNRARIVGKLVSLRLQVAREVSDKLNTVRSQTDALMDL